MKNHKKVPGVSMSGSIPGISKTKNKGGKLFGKASHNAVGNKNSVKRVLGA